MGLLEEDEKVLMAFKNRGGAGRDDKCFTNKRILKRDVKAMTGKCIRYKSIPYHSIKAFAIETAGSLDTDTNLKVWSEGKGLWSTDFVAGKVDMYAIMRFLNEMVLSVEGA